MSIVKRSDMLLLALVMIFTLIGLIMISSVSVYPSYADTLKAVQK